MTRGGRRSRIHRGGAAQRAARQLLVDQARALGAPLVCRRCGFDIDPELSGLHPRGLTVGHVVSVADGGTDELWNLAPEHRRCNLAPGRVTAPRALIATPVEVM